MNKIIPKTEWIKTWTDNGVGWIQLSHENKLNPLSASFILAIKDAAKKFDKDKIYEKAMSHKKFVPINLVSELTWEEFSKLNANLHKLDGIFPRIGTKRFYTAGESHSHLIGYIAPITKDEKNNNPRLQVKSKEEYAEIMENLNLSNPKMMDVAVPANVKGLTLDQI